MAFIKNFILSKTTQQSHESVTREVNLGEEVRRLMHREDIAEAIEAASPFLLAATVAWPTVWLARGLDWHTKRGKETLPLYIRKTFFVAKGTQLTVLLLGLLYAVSTTPKR
ncbi:unnamed protein product [Ceratitis capitata]|uniref:(Mediterranean fruit fly) hypothetical protein n=1 Tax=Ceratitis capitata TaxID=7213 RepID=W8AW08_CERCA|nr:unnamed protein product [Ceratitis capitata]